MATLPELQGALVNAHNAGDSDAARRIAAVINREQSRRQQSPQMHDLLSLEGEPQVESTVAKPASSSSSLADIGLGALETGAALATGMTGGMAGQIEGTIEGIVREIAAGDFGSVEAANRIAKLAEERAQALTFAPNTSQGKEMLQTTGEALAPLAAIPPLAELQALGSAAGQVPVRAQAAQAAAPVKQLASRIAEEATARLNQRRAPSDSNLSAGAAQVDTGTLRQARADELPVKMDLTEGQKTRDFEQQRFERETAKTPEGERIRERFDTQNRQLQQNMDEFIDATGSQVSDLRGVGELVDSAFRSRIAKDKTKIRTLFKSAEKSGEMRAPITLDGVVRHINDSTPEATTAPIIKVMADTAEKLGLAKKGADGELIPLSVDLATAEQFRRTINRNTGIEAPNIRQSSIMKRMIDDATESAGGDIYRQARSKRREFAQKFENISLIKNLVGTKKGSNDRSIALEDVVRKGVLEPSTSLDSVKQLRRLLQTSGEKGKQAWAELQGATLRHINDQMTKNITTNQLGERVVSPAALDRAIQSLDKNGKLDFIFGKKGAEQLRVINDVAKDVLTTPQGVVNTSNTATVLAGMLDVVGSGLTGVPAPIASSLNFMKNQIKNKKLKKRIDDALGEGSASKRD